MPHTYKPIQLDDSLLEFPNAFRLHGCYTSPPSTDESFSVSKGSLPHDRISYWKITCHAKSRGCFPILGIYNGRNQKQSQQEQGKAASAAYLDDTFFGWRADASSWQKGEIVRAVEWPGFRANQQLIMRYDPVSSPRTHFLSIQVVDTDIEATMFVTPLEEEYRISMVVDTGSEITFSSASVVDTRYWEIQQEILNAKNELASKK